jgi:hypothetical protein
VIAPPAVDPALPTALPAEGLAPDRPEATLPATPLTVEPTFAPVLATTFETVPVADGIGVFGGTTHPAPLQPAGTLTLGDGVDEDGAFGCDGEDPLVGEVPFGRVPAGRERPPRVTAPGPPAVAPAWEAAATRTLLARDGADAFDCDTATATGAGGLATCGQPRNATNALARRNIAAAPATNDPEVPKPARYARVARTLGRYRTSGAKTLPLLFAGAPGSSKALNQVCQHRTRWPRRLHSAATPGSRPGCC